MKKLAIVSTHPIQYYAPVFKLLSEREGIQVKVFYTSGVSSINKYDHGFGKRIEWDIPLLNSYDYEFVENIAKDKGSHHFRGIVNPSLIKLIKNFEPDAMLVYGWSNYSHLRVIRHFHDRIPVWFRGDSTNLNPIGLLKGIVRNVLLRWVYSHVDKAFYVGKASRRYFNAAGLTDNQLIWAPHAVDNSRFNLDPSTAESLRNQLGIKENERLVMYAGKFDPVKNLELLLEGFVQIGDINSHLVLVGNGKLESLLKERYGKHNRVHFIDFQNQTQLPRFYQACDIFCLPSLSETWGLAVNEAMACGKAILVSDKVGCAEDLVFDGENGYVFRSGNLEEFKIKLRQLLFTERLSEMGRRSQDIIKNWTFESQASIIAKSLLEL